MHYEWHDFVGNAGVVLILVTYTLLQLRRMDSHGLAFSVLNAVGAALIIVSLFFAFNASAMIVEVFWCAISLFGVVRWRKKRTDLVFSEK